MEKPSSRILIAEQHALVSGLLRHIVVSAGDLELAGEVATGADLLDAVSRQEIDVLLLGTYLRDAGSMELLGRVHLVRPALPVCLVSLHENPRALAVPALRAGAAGLVTRSSRPESILDAIRALARGERFVDGAALDDMMRGICDGTSGRALSQRESQVFQMLTDGRPTSEIASALKLSPKTVSTHKTRLCQKLRVHSVAELVRYAIEHRIGG